MRNCKVLYTIACALFFLHSWALVANGSIEPTDLLEMSFEEMLNIKITTAGKKSEKISDIPASVVIVTRRDIETYGYMSLEEILENVPGMFVNDDLGPYRKTVGVRGFYSGYPRNIIFLVNGVPQTERLFDYNILSNFNIPVEVIDKIEIVRGPMSVVYGEGAFFGAINIITNDVEDLTSLISFSVGNGMERAATKVSGAGDSYQYAMSAGYSNSDGPDHPLDGMVSDMTSLATWKIDADNNTSEGRLERDSKNFIFSGKYGNFYTDFSFNDSCDEAFAFRPSVSNGSPYDREMLKMAVGYETRLSDTVRIDSRVTYHDFTFKLDFDIDSTFFDGDKAGQTRGKSKYYEYELDLFYDMCQPIQITSGLYYRVATETLFEGEMPIFNVEGRTKVVDEMKLWALFTQLNLTPWEKLRLVAGLRMERMGDYVMRHEFDLTEDPANQIQSTYGQDKGHWIPSLAVIYQLDDQNVLKFLYGQSIAYPSFFQNRDQLMAGFPNLEPEEIDTVEFNWMMIPDPHITLNLSLFYNILDHLIVRTIDIKDDELVEFFSNDGNLVTKGAEITVQWKPTERLFTEVSVSYQHTEDERDAFEDIEPGYSPHMLGYVKMSYALNDKTTLAVIGTYVDEMETEWDIRMNGYAGGRIGQTVDDYFLLGANLRINDLFEKEWYLNIHGSNILDETYHYPTYVNNTWADKGTPGDPMQFLVTVGKKF